MLIQSERNVNTSKRPQARENASDQIATILVLHLIG